MTDSPRLVLVAGATGLLGRHVVRELHARGTRVRILSRRAPVVAAGAFRKDDGSAGGKARPVSTGVAAAAADRSGSLEPGNLEFVRGDVLDPASLRGTCDSVDAVISCVGASLDLYAWKDRLSYSRVDAGGNLALLEAARQAGVPRFTYVSVFATADIEQTAYVRAHREVERALATSPLDTRIVRPTGFFGFLDEFVRMARRGLAPIVGDGSARTNPVDEEDLAGFVARAFDGEERVLEVGGPDVLSRAEIAQLAAAAVGRRVRTVRSSPAAWRAASRLLARVQPRLSELLEFAAVVSTTTAIAPPRGSRRLEDHFRELVGKA